MKPTDKYKPIPPQEDFNQFFEAATNLRAEPFNFYYAVNALIGVIILQHTLIKNKNYEEVISQLTSNQKIDLDIKTSIVDIISPLKEYLKRDNSVN